MHKKVHLVAAARPNFIKIAPLYHALAKEPWVKTSIVHTGQHYDLNMSDTFFQNLGLPEPDIHLNIGSGTHAEQTGGVMIAYEKELLRHTPHLVIVVGDVNSTVACALAAVKLGIKTAHLEAGLRSFDRTMPEEINRIVTDSIADFLWTPSPDADDNLTKEGKEPEKIIRVGNIMIDSIEMMRDEIEKENATGILHLNKQSYCLVTFHRPSNVDNKNQLKKIMTVLEQIALQLPVVFSVHPRTRNSLITLKEYGFLSYLDDSPLNNTSGSKITFTTPLPYVSFMNLIFNAKVVITDSGGIQEETTYLGIPCITLRDNTERPITITQGTNVLCKPDNLMNTFKNILKNDTRSQINIDMWDGRTAQRIVNQIKGLKFN